MPSKLSPIGVEHGKMELRNIVNEIMPASTIRREDRKRERSAYENDVQSHSRWRLTVTDCIAMFCQVFLYFTQSSCAPY